MRQLFITMALGLALGAGLPAPQNGAAAQPLPGLLVQAQYQGPPPGYRYPPPPARHWLQHNHGPRHWNPPPPPPRYRHHHHYNRY